MGFFISLDSTNSLDSIVDLKICLVLSLMFDSFTSPIVVRDSHFLILQLTTGDLYKYQK